MEMGAVDQQGAATGHRKKFVQAENADIPEGADRFSARTRKQGMRAIFNEDPPLCCAEAAQFGRWVGKTEVMDNIQGTGLRPRQPVYFIQVHPQPAIYPIEDTSKTGLTQYIQLNAAVISGEQDAAPGF